MENVETQKMSPEEVRKLGIPRRPPGQGNQPGHFMHQQGGGATGRFWRVNMLPIYPMLAMVGLGLCLAGWNSARLLGGNATVELSKRRRQGFLEIDDPDAVAREHSELDRKNFLKKLAMTNRAVDK